VIVGDPRLGPLRPLPTVSVFPSFPVFVHALLPGSPAIDHGTCTGFPDQRNYGRPSGAACDIGAFESTPLFNGGVEMVGTRLALRRRPVPGGTTALKVKGRLLFTDPLTPAVDPAHDGLQVRIEDLGSPGGALVEHTHVTEPLVPSGWQASGPRFRWKIPSPEKSTIVVKDRRVPNGYVDFKATLTRTLDPMLGPIRLTVVLGGPVTGDNAAGDAGACATHVFTCVGVPGGPKLKCT
jgi:hypothetical protein